MAEQGNGEEGRTVEDAPSSDVPVSWELWRTAVHTVLYTTFFLFISCIAVGIDLSLHWLERLPVVEHYGISSVIKWEIEAMAYTLATVDCFLFTIRIIEPIVDFVKDVRKP